MSSESIRLLVALCAFAIGFDGVSSCKNYFEVKCDRNAGRTPRPGFHLTKLPDDVYGAYNFSLELHNVSRVYDTFEISVMYSNVADKTDCKADRNLRKSPILRTDIFATLDDNCNTIYLQSYLRYFFTGCFIFKVTPRKKGIQDASIINYKWIENHYNISDFIIKAPHHWSNYYGNCVNVTWQLAQDIICDGDIKVSLDEKPVSRDMCFRSRNNSKEDVTCTFCNISGSHNATLKVINEWRCEADDVFGICYWKTNFDMLKIENEVILHEESKNDFLSGLVIFIVVFTICVLSLVSWIFFKKREVKMKNQQTYDNELCSNVECHVNHEKIDSIYLVYPRDTPSFMKVMVNFRVLLGRLTGYKVYDIHDDEMLNEIALSPNEWVQSRIQNPNIKVVLIATECAEVLYQNLLKYHSTSKKGMDESCYLNIYQVPRYCDSVVLYSLKLISQDMTSTPYHKFFVVRFPKFNTDEDYLTHINPFKRFDMPENLKFLAENILHQSHTGDNAEWEFLRRDFDKLLPKVEVNEKIFIESVNEMNEFFKENPDYLMEEILRESYRIIPTGII